MSWMKIFAANTWSRFAWEKVSAKNSLWKCHLGDMKSRPLAPSPVKQRWMLLMNFLNKKLFMWTAPGAPTLDLYDGKGNTTFIIFIAVIKIMIGVTFESISSCKRRAPIVCLALMLCLLQTRPVCWSKGWWLQMMAIWWFSGIKWRGRINATVVVTFVKRCIGRCRRANWGWSLFPCGKYLFVMTHLLPHTGH